MNSDVQRKLELGKVACQVCERGHYRVVADGSKDDQLVKNFLGGQTGKADRWAVARCASCGHVLLFREWPD